MNAVIVQNKDMVAGSETNRARIAAVITPPDVVSQLALAVPMCLLYEVGIWAAQIFIKHTKAPEEETTS